MTGARFRYGDNAQACSASLCWVTGALIRRPVRATSGVRRRITTACPRQWEAAGYDRIQPGNTVPKAVLEDGRAVVACELSLAAVVVQRALTATVRYEIGGDGAVAVSSAGLGTRRCPCRAWACGCSSASRWTVPLILATAHERNYIDKRRASYKGKFETTARGNAGDYIKPQENGSHYGCNYVRVGGLTAVGWQRPGSPSASTSRPIPRRS